MFPDSRGQYRAVATSLDPSLHRDVATRSGGGGVEVGGGCGGVKQGPFIIFRFPLLCSVWGFQDTQPLTSFETKKWLEVNFPSRGKS